MRNDLILYIKIGILPLVLTNILHMFIVKFDVFRSLSVPINKEAFGKNKTWRGLLFVPLVNMALVYLTVQIFNITIENPMFVGLLLGLAYVIFELPNSYLKRRLKIPPGGLHSKNKIFFSLLDKSDSAFGVALMYFLLGLTNFSFAILLFLLNSSIHIILSLLLVKLRIKKSF